MKSYTVHEFKILVYFVLSLVALSISSEANTFILILAIINFINACLKVEKEQL